MVRSLSHSSGVDDNGHDLQELQEFVSHLSQLPERESVASEIEVLQSIYGDSAIRLYHSDNSNGGGTQLDTETVRYEVTLSFPSPHEDVSVKVLVSLPPTYPTSSSPQLQLLSKYIGAFGVDPSLFGSILRTYISVNGVEFVEDQVCVFDGLQNVFERCVAWYEEQLSLEKAGQLVRQGQRDASVASRPSTTNEDSGVSRTQSESENSGSNTPAGDDHPASIPLGIVFYVAEPIQDRKSSFIGRACRISHPSEVPQIIAHLLSDRKLARAAHPVINAWRCQVGNLLHQDNDDDGETAAGGRLAHLLQILEVNDVLVVVTRYFGGIHLGPDRFKHINQAARNALELGGFLDAQDNSKKHVGRSKKH